MMDFTEMMERARMEAWCKVSPMSNLHSAACAADCYDTHHYPEGSPISDDDEDRSTNEINFLNGTIR